MGYLAESQMANHGLNERSWWSVVLSIARVFPNIAEEDSAVVQKP